MRKSRYAAMIAAIVAAVGIAPPQAFAAAPSPVFAPANGIADPGVVRTGGDFYAFSTGTRAPVSQGDAARLGLRHRHDALPPGGRPVHRPAPARALRRRAQLGHRRRHPQRRRIPMRTLPS
ncbi:MAG TPA: hypothetical protein VFC19_32400 [Candidatus Limnocylindrales bacterium]|nr:hypothetical protein [Candidatus Limnocylindrales bacterium]